MKAQYRFVSGSRLAGLDAQKVGESLNAIRNRGALTPQAVVEAARARSHPLHSFIWGENEATAAAEWRLSRAGYVLRSIELVRVATPHRVRAFVPVRTKMGPKRHYVSVTEALKKARTRNQVLAQALAELRAFKARYAALKELADVIAAIDGTLAA